MYEYVASHLLFISGSFSVLAFCVGSSSYWAFFPILPVEDVDTSTESFAFRSQGSVRAVLVFSDVIVPRHSCEADCLLGEGKVGGNPLLMVITICRASMISPR